MGDANSARLNASPGVALPIPCRSIHPLRASSWFWCINTSQICVHHLNPALEPDRMVVTELHCVQLIIQYISLGKKLRLDRLPSVAGDCHVVHCVLGVVEVCSEVIDHSVRMRSITVVMGPLEFGLRI
jgi:hypothetical protein